MSHDSAPKPAGASSADGARRDRRGFLVSIAALIGGAVALLTPIGVGVAALLSPLRKSGGGARSFRVTTLANLPDDGVPHKFALSADRVDGWNLFRNEPVGAVYLCRQPGKQEVLALQVECPHAGCVVGFTPTPEGGKFYCPCHQAGFDLAGRRTDAVSHSPRDMDVLDVEVRGAGDVWVKFERFKQNTAKKVPLA